jgi:DNA replicative helicase MCM subunit Mcm2 (Cdc46/Mcm family)
MIYYNLILLQYQFVKKIFKKIFKIINKWTGDIDKPNLTGKDIKNITNLSKRNNVFEILSNSLEFKVITLFKNH